MRADCQHCHVHIGDIGSFDDPGSLMKYCPYCGDRIMPIACAKGDE